jgi:lipopolysaccharide export system permease protein
MRLLDRYLLRELLVPLGYCLGGFLSFWITFQLISDLSTFQRYQLRWGDILSYYIVTLPETLVTIIPLALLLALLYALTNHARHHELTAMRAAGLTLWRAALPYFGVAICAGLGIFALNEWAVPESAERAEQILHCRSAGASASQDQQWQRGLAFVNSVDQRTWIIGAYNLRTGEMLKPHLEWVLPDGTRRQINADRAVRTNGHWLFQGVQQVILPFGTLIPPAPMSLETLLLPELTETPRLIQNEIKISQLDSLKAARRTQLSLEDIRNCLKLHPQLDAQRRDLLLTMLHSRLALPWTCLVVVLIALPFGAASGRRNVFVGVASSVFICFVFFVLRELSLALGGGGRVEPWLAAWLPNLVFGTAGIVLTQRTR